MIQLSSENPIVIVIVALLFLVIGGGARGFYLSFRRDKRRGRVDEAELLNAVRRSVRNEMRRMEWRLARAEQRADRAERERLRVEGYVETQRRALVKAGVPVPPWPPELPPEPDIPEPRDEDEMAREG